MHLVNLSTTHDDIFWYMYMFDNNASSWNFTMTEVAAPYQEPYPFADVCFPYKFATGFAVQMALLLKQSER